MKTIDAKATEALILLRISLILKQSVRFFYLFYKFMVALLVMPIAVPVKMIRSLHKYRRRLIKPFRADAGCIPFQQKLKTLTHGPDYDSDKCNIFVFVGHGQAVRFFLISRCCRLLAERFNVIVLSPYAQQEEFSSTFNRNGVNIIFWPHLNPLPFHQFRRFYHLCRSASETHRNMAKNIEKSPRLKYSKWIMYQVAKYLRFPKSHEFFRSLYFFLFWFIAPNAPFKVLFQFFKPVLFINTVANNHTGYSLSAYARAHGIKVLANIISWDNPSTKGVMDEYAQHYTVWNKNMEKELERFFPKLKAKTHVVGAPQFDCYREKKWETSRKDFMASLDLDPSIPYVLYTTNTPKAMPDEPQIVRAYWEALKQSDLNGSVNMVVRLHPKDQMSRYDTIFEDLADTPVFTLAGEPKTNHTDKWVPAEPETRLLVNSLKHSALTVNVASTMSLESFCVDKPTINVAFQLEKLSPMVLWDFSMYHTSAHYRTLVDEGAVRLARSVEELVALTAFYLQNPEADRDARSKVLAFKVGEVDGHAAERFAKVVETIANGHNLDGVP